MSACTRRTLLAALATGLAGCSSAPTDSPTTSTGSNSPSNPTSTTRRRHNSTRVATTGPGSETAPPVEEPTDGTGPVNTQPGPVERESMELADVRVESQHSFVGASALVYNASPRDREAQIRFQLYDPRDRVRYDRTEWVRIPADEQRRAATWWRRDRPGTSSPEIASVDVEIVAVTP